MLSLFKDPPSGAQHTGLQRLPIVYAGNASITLNDPNSPITDTYELEDLSFSPTVEGVMENKQGRDGMEAFEVFRAALMLRLAGFVKAPTIAALHDKAGALAYAFEPTLLSRRTAGSSLGFATLSFDSPTSDLVTYPSGLVPSFYRARAIEPVVFGATKYDGLSMAFTIDLLMRDPFRYYAVQSVRSGQGAMDNMKGELPSWPILTVVMSGAGNPDVYFENEGAFGGVKSLHLDLSSCVNGDVIVVDMERRTIKKNGALAMSMYVSGNYWMIEPKNNTQVFDRGVDPNIVSSTVTWYPVFAV